MNKKNTNRSNSRPSRPEEQTENHLTFPDQLAQQWNNRRYYPVSVYFKQVFGRRVFKAGVDSGLSCPNRDGSISSGGCTYCDNEAFRTGGEFRRLSITRQLHHETAALQRRYRADTFLAYFQTYSNTYGPVEQLEQLYREALSYPGIAGLSISTRPDCLDPYKADLLAQLHREKFVQVELGLQSIDNDILRSINRGHTVEQFITAVHLLAERGVPVCAHVILGLPGETVESMLAGADLLNRLEISGCKLHQLQIFKGTMMAEQYQAGLITVPELEHYLNLTGAYLARLSPQINIQRLFGISNGDRVVAPQWDLPKQSMLQIFNKWLADNNCWQSKDWQG